MPGPRAPRTRSPVDFMMVLGVLGAAFGAGTDAPSDGEPDGEPAGSEHAHVQAAVCETN